jgi:hypothetical protein
MSNPNTNDAGRYSQALQRWRDGGRKGPPPTRPPKLPRPYRDEALLFALKQAAAHEGFGQAYRQSLSVLAQKVSEYGLAPLLEHMRTGPAAVVASADWLEHKAARCEAVAFPLTPAEARRQAEARRNQAQAKQRGMF